MPRSAWILHKSGCSFNAARRCGERHWHSLLEREKHSKVGARIHIIWIKRNDRFEFGNWQDQASSLASTLSLGSFAYRLPADGQELPEKGRCARKYKSNQETKQLCLWIHCIQINIGPLVGLTTQKEEGWRQAAIL